MAKPDLSADHRGSAQAQPGAPAEMLHAAGAGGQTAKLKDMQATLRS
jgi:hypothetical protein